MKDAKKFVCYGKKSIKEKICEYKEIQKILESELADKEKYDKMYNEKMDDISKLTFRDRVLLVKTIRNLSNEKPNDFDLYLLCLRLNKANEDVISYEQINSMINSREREINEILKEDITFDYFRKDEFEERCECCGHILVNFGDELKCLYCNATTKDYDITKEEVDFLTLCAEKQGLLFKDITEEDLPFLQVLLENFEQERKESIKSICKEYKGYNRWDIEAEIFYTNEIDNILIKKRMERAHLIDNKKYDGEIFSNNCFSILEEKEAKILLDNIEQDLEKIKASDSKYKDFMIEECNTAKYEVLILSGKHIPTLVEEVTNEDDMIALTKAYYNLSNKKYTKNSELFKEFDNFGGLFDYICLTANNKINSKILEMKVRR